MDLSFGNYTIKKAVLNSCNEDKGISLGENSNGKFENIIILNSKLGIVVKDSSKALIDNLVLKKY